MFKRLIRKLYWKYGHKGDMWQMKLVVHHMNNISLIMDDSEPVPERMDIILSQLNEKLNDNLNQSPLQGFAHVQIRNIEANK